ncbi:MAG: cytosine permease, partial [Calditrichia bacterium]|nr:cytosine permease [Calditrichia bacterium]
MGILLIIWGSNEAGGFSVVLEQGKQLEKPTAVLYNNSGTLEIQLTPLKDVQGKYKADEYQLSVPASLGEKKALGWQKITDKTIVVSLPDSVVDKQAIITQGKTVDVQFRKISEQTTIESSSISLVLSNNVETGSTINFWGYILWLTAMVGFWATMSLSIADITRYARTQKEQVIGQFLGLPGTMLLYSFIGIFVTFAAVVNFHDILISQDAPWDPVSLLA